MAEAKSSYNNGLNDSYGDSEGYELSVGRVGAQGERKLESMVGTLMLDDGHSDGHGHSPSPSRRHTHRPGGTVAGSGGGGRDGLGAGGLDTDEDLGMTAAGGFGPDDDADSGGGGGGGGGAEAMTGEDLDAALNSGMVDGISEQDVEDIFRWDASACPSIVS